MSEPCEQVFQREKAKPLTFLLLDLYSKTFVQSITKCYALNAKNY